MPSDGRHVNVLHPSMSWFNYLLCLPSSLTHMYVYTRIKVWEWPKSEDQRLHQESVDFLCSYDVLVGFSFRSCITVKPLLVDPL